MPAGRPSEYTPEIGKVICERIASGDSLRRIASDDGMPETSTIMRWKRDIEEFRLQYTRAKVDQMDYFAEQLIEIADQNEGDVRVNADGEICHDNDHIQRMRLRLDTRKWLMTKLAIKKYGDKQEQNITGNITVTRLIFAGEPPPALEHEPDDE